MFGHEIFLSVRFDQFLATDLQGIIICASDDLRHLTVRFPYRVPFSVPLSGRLDTWSVSGH